MKKYVILLGVFMIWRCGELDMDVPQLEASENGFALAETILSITADLEDDSEPEEDLHWESATGVAGIPPSWHSPYGEALDSSDDDCDNRSLGFTFSYYGQEFTDIWINSNGNLTFGACNRSWGELRIPDGDKRIIGALYGDFNPQMAGDVYVTTVGVAPRRRFVVTWNGIPEYRPENTGHSTFQVQLLEGSNQIQLGYRELGTDGINWSGDLTMDVGISSGTGQYENVAIGTQIPHLSGTNICFTPWSGGYQVSSRPCELWNMNMTIDVRPCNRWWHEHPVYPGKWGRIPVAILMDSSLSIQSIDLSTLRFGPGGASIVHDPGDFTTWSGRRKHLKDIDGDGDLDLILHFRTQETGIQCGDTEAELIGYTFDGRELKGKDFIRTQGCGKRRKHNERREDQ